MLLLLSLCWLLIGLLIGILAIVARLQAVAWIHDEHVSILAIGGLAALAGGWLGTLVFGSLFATATAVWMSVVGVVAVPWLIQRWRIN